MIKSEIYAKIMREYEKLSIKAHDLLQQRKQILYEKCPRILEIDNQLSFNYINLSKLILDESISDKNSYIEKTKLLTKKLNDEKNQIMLENGFDINFLENIYICPKCKDTGLINNKKCDCFKQKIIDEFYHMSNLSFNLKEYNFSNFNKDFYSQEINQENKMSPYDNISNILKKISIFIEYFNKNSKVKNIIFYGEVGTGKTFLCNCIGKQILDMGNTVIYTTAFDLFSKIEKQRFNKDFDMDSDILKYKYDVDLLIIDDLGTEFITTLSLSELFNIINMRILNNKSTIISTNLSPEDLMNIYSSRVVSRFYGEYEMMKLFGNDIRIEKKFG